MRFRSLFGFAIGLGFNVNTASAECLVAPDTWELKEYQAVIVWQSHADEINALQGVLSVPLGNDEIHFATHGYAASNVSIWSSDGVLQKAEKLGDEDPAALIADVAFDGDHLWWTDYRNGLIFRTDLALENMTSFTSDAWQTTLVGITYSRLLDSIVFPLRDKRADLVIADRRDPNTFKIVRLTASEGRLRDVYDVASADDCLFIVSRGDGQIYSVEEGDLRKGRKADMDLLLDGLQHPQHMVIRDERLYVIETKAHRVSRFDFRTGIHAWIPVPDARIFRGLTVDQDGTVVLSGFRDAIDISEERTTLIRLAFEE